MKTKLLKFALLLAGCLPLAQTAWADKEIYIPQQLKDEGYSETETNKKWSKVRSRENENIIVFWDEGYGDNDPNSTKLEAAYRVDVDDMLEKLNIFYKKYTEELKFAELGVGKSNLDKYKMVICLYYTTDWMAYGSGFDNVIGGMWVSPSTCHPVGQTIAHELGHSFQYEVYCDLGGNTGFRDGPAGAFWEQCAQWMSYENYPQIGFDSYDFTCYQERCNLHFSHEWIRYASYFLQDYWADKYGDDFIGRLWRFDTGATKMDACQAYIKMMGLSAEEFYREMFDAALKLTTFDLDKIRDLGTNYIGKQRYEYVDLGNKTFQVAYSSCPQNTGYNVIPLKVPEAGTRISTVFTALTPGCDLAEKDPGVAHMSESKDTVTHYNTFARSTARGFRHGYVALLKDGSRVYSYNDTIYAQGTDEVNDTTYFVVPENTERIWFVVSPSPKSYIAHPWDDKLTNDDQWPYRFKLENSDILGRIDIDWNKEMADTTIEYYIGFDPSATLYDGTLVTITGDNAAAMGTAFQMLPSEVQNHMTDWKSTIQENEIMLYAVRPNNKLVSGGSTANGYGHWFDAEGNVCTWGEGYLYSEFNPATLTFTIGQKPGMCQKNQVYTFRQALRYKKDGKYVRTNFVFHVFMGGVPTGINSTCDETKKQTIEVYNLNGQLVIRQNGDLDQIKKRLNKGIYIIQGVQVSIQ